MSTLTSLGLDSEQNLVEYLRNYLSHNPSSPLFDVINREFGRIIENNLNATAKAKSKTIVITEKLSVDEQILLSNTVPEYSLVFNNTVFKTHSYASAIRKTEYQLLLDKIGYHPSKVKDDFVYAIDIGGDFSYHLINGNFGIHSDCPVTCERDDVRYATRIDRVKKYFEGKIISQPFVAENDASMNHIKLFLQETTKCGCDKKFFCPSYAQNCTVSARYGLMVHSGYDIPLNVLGDIMSRKNIWELHGTMIFSPDVFLNTNGHISGIEAYYVIDQQADTIEFSFKGCSSFNYKHSFTTYASYFMTSVFFSSDKKSKFLLELMENRSGIQFFKVTRLADTTPTSAITHQIWLPSMYNKSIVTYYDIDYDNLAARSGKPTLKIVNAIVDTKLVDKLKSQATAQTETKFKPAELFCFIQAYCGRMFIGSDVVMRHEPISASTARALAYAVYIEVYREKYDSGRILQRILSDIDHDRKLAVGGLFTKLISSFKTFMLATGASSELRRYFSNSKFKKFNRSIFFRVFHKKFWKHSKSELGMVPYIVPSEEFIKYTSVGHVKILKDVKWKRKSPDEKQAISEFFASGFTVPDDKGRCLFSYDVNALYLDILKQNFGVNVAFSEDTDKITIYRNDDTDRFESVQVPYYLWSMNNASDHLEDHEIYPYFSEFPQLFSTAIDEVNATDDFTSTWSELIRRYKFKLSADSVLFIDYDHDFSKEITIKDSFSIVITRKDTLFPVLKTSNVLMLSSTIRNMSTEFSRYSIKTFNYVMFDNTTSFINFLDNYHKFLSMESVVIIKLSNLVELKAVTSYSAGFFASIDLLQHTVDNQVATIGYLVLTKYSNPSDIVIINNSVETVINNTIKSYFVNGNVNAGVLDLHNDDDSFVFVEYAENENGDRIPYFSDDETIVNEYDDRQVRCYPIPEDIYEFCKNKRATTLLITSQSILSDILFHRESADLPSYERIIYSFEQESFDGDVSGVNAAIAKLATGGDLFVLLPTCERSGLSTFVVEMSQKFLAIDMNWEHDVVTRTVRGYIHYQGFAQNQTDFTADLTKLLHEQCRNLLRRRNQFRLVTPVTRSIISVEPSTVRSNSVAESVTSCRAEFYISSASSAYSTPISSAITGYSVPVNSQIIGENSTSGVTELDDSDSANANLEVISNIIPVLADGNCLCYALMGGDNNSVDRFKEIIGVSTDISGVDDANSIINAFSRVFSAFVTVVKSDASFFFGVTTNAVQECSLLLEDQHYSIQSRCDRITPVGQRNKIFNYNAVDLNAFLSVIQNFTDKSVIDLSDHNSDADVVYYYNAIRNFCHLHPACVNGKFDIAVQKAITLGLSELWFLFDLKNFDAVNYDLVVKSYYWELFTPLQIYSKEYIIVTVKFNSTIPQDNFNTVFEAYKKHFSSCDDCKLNTSLSKTVCDHGFYRCPVVSPTVVKTICSKPSTLNIKLANNCGMPSTSVVMGAGYVTLFCHSQHGIVEVTGIKEQLALVPKNFFTTEVTIELNGFRDVSIIAGILVFDYKVSSISYIDTPIAQEVPTASALFTPKLRPVLTPKDIIINSMEEVRELHRITEASVVSTLSRYHAKVLQSRGGLSVWARNHPEFRVAKPDYGMLNLETGDWYYKPLNLSARGYHYGFNGKELVDISAAFNDNGSIIPGKIKGVYSVSKDSSLLNSKVIYDNMNAYDLDVLELDFKVKLIGGVPGCGKTYEIINQHNFSKNDSKHMILTSSTETCKDLRRRVAEKYNMSSDHPILSIRYRTVDSLLMHLDKISGDTEVLWFDEGLMRHCGEIFWAAVLTGAKVVNVYGDKCQIPFINRIAGVKQLLYSDITNMGDSLAQEFRDVSRRVPADVACYLNAWNIYPSTIKTFNTRKNTVIVRRIRTIRDILTPHYKNYIFLVFTQAEKYDLLAIDSKLTVFTVHEFQGNEAPMVMLLRFGKKNDVYDSVNHQLVAISRHTKTFIYATTAGKEDTFADFLHRTFPSEVLKQVMVNLNGGGESAVFETSPLFMLDLIPEQMVDILKRQRNIRDFVQAHGAYDVIPMKPHFRHVPHITYSPIQVAPALVSNPIQVIQSFYDEVFPGCGYADTSFDSDIFESEEIYFPKAVLSLNDTLGANKRKWDTLSPVLRTACPRVQRQTQKNVLKSFFDRNGAVPEFATLADENLMADQLCEALVSTCIGDTKAFSTFIDHPITINCESIKEWFKTQPPSVESMVFSDDGHYNIFQRELDLYNYILKVLPKPKLEQFSDLKNPSPQTIAHHCKQINAIFCPIVRELKKRFLAVLRVDKLVFTDSSVENFEEILNVRLPLDVVERFPNMLEIDISKYDKSQGLIALLFEVQILRKLGMPEDLLPLWVYMHVFTRLKSPVAGVEAYINLQRKSGDAMTFFGNTLFLMAVASNVFTLKDSFCMFSGDDSLVFSPVTFNTVGVSQIMANTYNLEAKFMRFKTPYFCSKHLFATFDGKWHFVPDIIKLITKLGRSDLAGFNHVEEYRRSVSDNIKPLVNSLIYDQLSYSIVDRYGVTTIRDFSMLFRAIFTLTQDKDTFSSLFYQKDGAELAPYEANTPLHEF